MKKNLSYREKLLELGNIYKVSEIKNYTKNKKYLTTPQLELILKKNKVPIPTEINKSLIEIQVKKISKPVYSTGNKISGTIYESKKFIFGIWYCVINLQLTSASLRNREVNLFNLTNLGS